MTQETLRTSLTQLQAQFRLGQLSPREYVGAVQALYVVYFRDQQGEEG